MSHNPFAPTGAVTLGAIAVTLLALGYVAGSLSWHLAREWWSDRLERGQVFRRVNAGPGPHHEVMALSTGTVLHRASCYCRRRPRTVRYVHEVRPPARAR